MSLPRISPYPMPRPEELPANRVEWQPDPNRAALLVHDMQRHFLAPFEPGSEPLPELFANIGLLRDRCTELGVPVIYSAQPGNQTSHQRGLLLDFWGEGIVAPGAERLVAEVAPRPGEQQLTKWRYSAFVGTDLFERLRAAGRDQLLICGVYAHIGCMLTATHAFMEQVQPFLAADAIADFSAADHRMAIEWAARTCAVVRSTSQLASELRPANPLEVTRERVRDEVRAALEEPPTRLGDDDDLLDYGLDSIAVMGILTAWREAGLEIHIEELIEAEPTVASWWGLVERAQHRAAV